MEAIKDVAAIVGCISAIIALITTIFRPARKRFIDLIKRTSEASETAIEIKEINKKITALEGITSEILGNIGNIDKRITSLDKRVFENERDRIKAELSEYASRCALGMKLYPEDKLHIDEIYSKYADELHCNSTGTEFYHEIIKYYDQQDWLKS